MGEVTGDCIDPPLLLLSPLVEAVGAVAGDVAGAPPLAVVVGLLIGLVTDPTTGIA